MSVFGRLQQAAKRNTFLYVGVPFLGLVALVTYGFSNLTQVRYDLQQKRVTTVSKEEQLGLDRNRKRLTMQQAYWDITRKKNLDDWDLVRVPGRKEDES
ncbi:hypothetical protein SmJEL517_g01592 [Synchytrium microbalum]|uniref:Cytochrome c oxidase assembly protein COX16, mitochondrial n=1 Tax=Synchytrium microbalum TaxID=1806994 RepID=A0A507CAC5_9FUNG|nr:uncharacterized protein SmJEL517_g01592 [Synchytrium microbalum]TPX36119.1 hypothetical protein SmJEL517_g01592 [Synchytrium microbalum]